MQDIAAHLAAVVLAGTLAWAAGVKAFRFSRWREALRRYELLPPIEAAARIGTPAAEAAAAAALVAGFAKAGAAAALALLAAVTLVLFSAQRIHGPRLPCGCLGGASARDYRIMLLRNSLLALCAALILADPDGIDLTSAPGPGTADFLPALFVGFGIVAGLVVVWQVISSVPRGRARPRSFPGSGGRDVP